MAGYVQPRLPATQAEARLRGEKKMAEYADVVAVSAAILQNTGMPAIVQGFWTEHSERSVLPTGLGVLGVSGPEKDLLGSRGVRYLR